MCVNEENKIPNPGSSQALDMGCTCPVLDNYHGRGFFYPGAEGPAFYIRADCPIHGERFKD